MKKKILGAIMGLGCVLTAASCQRYVPDYSYEPVDPGQLPAPSVDRKSEEYRQKYSTLGRYDEPVKITVAAIQYEKEPGVAANTTPENQSFNKLAKEVLNIDLEYVCVGSSTAYDQKLTNSIAAGDMPDMFFTTNTNVYSQLLEDDALADLSDVFWYLNDELQENYLEYFPELLPTVMNQGKLYSFPTITNTYTSAQRLYIRQDWLDIVGMEAPATMDEFTAVGQAFLDNKEKIAAQTGVNVDRIVPFTMNKELTWAGSYSAEGFLNCFGTSMNAYFEGEDGELYFSNSSPEMKNAITKLHELYEKGILDPTFLDMTAEKIQANIKSGVVGMAFGEWWMAKDVLDECVSNINGADWTWVDIPSAEGVDAKPIVKSVGVGGYNLVSKDCEHPEAAARLINLFYDIYYSDDAIDRYGDLVLPSKGFYYQFVPIKLWDGIASIREYERVQDVFNKLYDLGFKPADYVAADVYKEKTILQEVTTTTADDYVVSTDGKTSSIINRDVIAAINGNEAWKKEFDRLRTREKTLHFVDGYPYFVAYKSGKNVTEMDKGEKRGWGIYHEMIDPTGGYAYVVELTADTERKGVKFDCFYGPSLSSMIDYSDIISTATNEMFTQFITGDEDIKKFDKEYVKEVVDKKFGPIILAQVNAWYDSNQIDLENVYALVK